MSLRATYCLPFLFLFAPALMSQTPNLGTPRPFAGDTTPAPAAGIQRFSSIARGADSSLAVWSDYRTNAAGTPLINAQGASDIFGIRLDASGAPIDTVSIAIEMEAGDQVHPRVAWNGENWLVVWASQEPTQFYYATKLRAARVSPQGVVLDNPAIHVLDYELFADSLFAVTSDGANWGIVVEGTQGELRGVRISPQGNVLDPLGVQLYAGSFSLLQSVDMAFSGGEYLLAWEELVGANWTIRAKRFTPALGGMDAAPKTIAANANHVKVAGNGSEFYLVWQGGTVLGSRVSLAGNVLSPGGTNISGTVPFGPEPQVSWAGTQWLVTWMGFGPGSPAPLSTQVARISAAGAVLDFGGVSIDAGATADKRDPAVAGGTNGSGVVIWTDSRAGGINPEDIYSAGFSAAGVAGVGTGASLGAPTQTAPRFAFDGMGYLAVVRSEISGASRIVGFRLDAQGNSLDAQPIEVAVGATLRTPAVAWNGNVYLVAWSDGLTTQTIRARRLSSAGALLDPAPIAVMAGSSPDVAALGDAFLVVGVNAPSNPEIQSPFARRVSALDGSLLDAAPVKVGNSFAVGVQVESLGGQWVVAWEEHISHDESLANIGVNVVGATGIPGTEVTVGNNNHSGFGRVGLAASGNTALVTWDSGFGAATQVFGRLLLPSGAPTGAILTISNAINAQRRTAASWDGNGYVVAFEDLQNTTLFFDARTDVGASRVLESGAVLDPAGFGAFVAETPVFEAGAGGAGFGRSLIAAAVFHPEAPFANYRIETRMMRPAGLGNYGVGTPGCAGPHAMDANGSPQLGSAAFQLLCDNAPPTALGLVLVGNAAAPLGGDPLNVGVSFLVDPFASTFLLGLDAVSDPSGLGFAPAALPNDPALAGATFFGQAFWLWSAAVCTPSPFGLSSSNGLQITLVP